MVLWGSSGLRYRSRFAREYIVQAPRLSRHNIWGTLVGVRYRVVQLVSQLGHLKEEWNLLRNVKREDAVGSVKTKFTLNGEKEARALIPSDV